jgi:hypothetical protein
MQQIRMSGDRLDIIKKGQKGLEVKAGGAEMYQFSRQQHVRVINKG